MEKNFKHLIAVFCLSLAALLFLSGCATQPAGGVWAQTSPTDANMDAFPDNCRILGRVTVKADTEQSGYLRLLEEAHRLYRGTDDVINILVDDEVKNYIVFKKHTYTMTGIAVHYNNWDE